MQHPIIIFSDDTAVSNTVLSAVCTEPAFPVVGISSDDSLLCQLAGANRPSIVIVDCRLPGNISLEVIRHLKNTATPDISFIAIGEKQFDMIYQAVKAGAGDYLPVPVDPDELIASLKQWSARSENNHYKDTASRQFYLTDDSVDKLQNHPLDLEQLNITYGTHFTEGLFQMLFIKFDFPNSFERLNSNNTSIFQVLTQFITDQFKSDCSDIIFEIKSDGIMFLLNYPHPSQNSVNSKVLELYNRVTTLIRSIRSLDVTICVSSVVDDPCEVWKIKTQARTAEWSRMHYGLNKIIFWNPVSETTRAVLKKKLEPLSENVGFAIKSLNITRFRAEINDFYALSPNLLIMDEARRFIRQVISELFQLYWDTISTFTNPVVSYDELSYCLHLCTSFEQHRVVMATQCVKLMERIAAQSSQKLSPAVVKAINFVKNNVDKPIFLEDVASEVHLSTGYFSGLFKKEMGINFTRYVNNHKNTVACELLKTSNLNISEVAYRVGIQDVRAFSKKFHAANGTTPSQYKKLHKTEKPSVL